MRFLAELSARRRFGMKPGLETMRAILAAISSPERCLRPIHIAGTNGKGATAAILDAALHAAGFTTGRYTSPHLHRLNERFCLDGVPVVDARLEAAAEPISRLLANPTPTDMWGDVTFFEALTAVAFRLYADAAPDWTILETGLGGCLDATNVCQPCATIITRVGLDHCDWLGSTLEAIATEKAGIIKPGVPIILGANDPAVQDIVFARAQAVGAPSYYAPDFVDVASVPPLPTLPGRFNRENAQTALATLKVLLPQKLEACRLGFAHVVWPGRFQQVGSCLVDGAHNPPAARALRAALAEAYPQARFDVILGCCGDKAIDEVLAILAPVCRRVWTVRTTNSRSLDAAELATRVRALGLVAEPCASLAEALSHVPPAEGGVPSTLICGSLFLAGEALVAFGGYPWPVGTNAPDPAELLKIQIS